MSMITEKNIKEVLTSKLPLLSSELNFTEDKTCAYRSAAFFAAYTKKLIRLENFTEVENCLWVAEHLLNNGDYTVRNAIENVFLFSVSQAAVFDYNFMEGSIPPKLYKAYKKQTISSGI